MSYWNTPKSNSSPSLESVSLYSSRIGKSKSTLDEFYEIEPAIVLDIILDDNHSYFKNKKYQLNPNQWPVNINNKITDNGDLDYTWVGRVLVRLVYNNVNIEKENLVWALPLESNISEYPVLNETVGVIFYLGKYYYTRKINSFNTINANADFNSEISLGGYKNQNDVSDRSIKGNRELLITSSSIITPYAGPISKLNSFGSIGYSGALGRYFYYNPRIRSLKRREGDLIFESRFGQSIRFAAYDDIRDNDVGVGPDYEIAKNTYSYVTSSINIGFGGETVSKNPITNEMGSFKKYPVGGGNPMIIIRNRQRPLDKTAKEEKNVGGYMSEDINNDGTSIHITSGLTLSGFQTTCYKSMFGDGEEQKNFQPPGATSFEYPKLLGDQIVINSDRVIVSSKKNEMFHFSKKRMAFVTDDEYTVDAQNQIVMTTNNKTVINSPAIYLGEDNQTGEPVLLGQTTVNWLYELCNWMLTHTHWYKHTHPHVGQSDPPQTQTSVQVMKLQVLRDSLQSIMSRRVFVTGGGFAPGQNGGSIPVGAKPVSISIPSGDGVSGGWQGVNHR